MVRPLRPPPHPPGLGESSDRRPLTPNPESIASTVPALRRGPILPFRNALSPEARADALTSRQICRQHNCVCCQNRVPVRHKLGHPCWSTETGWKCMAAVTDLRRRQAGRRARKTSRQRVCHGIRVVCLSSPATMSVAFPRRHGHGLLSPAPPAHRRTHKPTEFHLSDTTTQRRGCQ